MLYSTRLAYRKGFTANTLHLFGTVPAGHRWLIKNVVHGFNNAATMSTFIYPAAAAANALWLARAVATAQDVIERQTWQVALPGDELWVLCTITTAALDIAVYGYDLVGP